MPIVHLTSRTNPVIQTLRLVASVSRRAPKDLVAAEGIRVLEEIETRGAPVQAVVLSEGFGLAPREKGLLDRWNAGKVRLYRTTESLFKPLSQVRSPQGAIALVRLPRLSLDAVHPGTAPLLVFAADLQDPGNLGTVIRTAAAAGATMVCVSAGSASPRNPKAVRASAGSLFRIPVVEGAAVSDFLDYCGRHSISAYRTDVRHGTSYLEADLRSPCAILLGNEGGGIPEAEFPGLGALRIPMAGGVESLNVAMAAAVILFEAARQRTPAGTA